MKNIQIESLALRNFKGIRELDIVASNGNLIIFGTNGTGKTSIIDAFMWLLFDKDSYGRKVFDLKTQDASGNDIHNLEHSVTGVLNIDGIIITLQKTYKEKWTKKRGDSTSTFTGNTTEYFIDSVPMAKKDYEEKVNSIIDETLFKLLTDPSYFCNQMTWQERRQILLTITGGITDDEVIASNKDLAALPAILSGKSIDDYKKIVAAQKAKINEELKTIPARIDEQNRNINADDASVDVESLAKEIEDIETEKRFFTEKIAFTENGSGQIELKSKIQEAAFRMKEIENACANVNNDVRSQKQKELFELQGKINDLRLSIGQKGGFIDKEKVAIENNGAELGRLRERWHKEDSTTFEWDDDIACPTCGQALPAHKVEAQKQKSLEHFNVMKADTLERITATGKELSAAIEKHKESIVNLETVIASDEKEIAALEAKKADVEKVLATIDTPKDFKEDAEYITLQSEKSSFEQELEKLQIDSTSAVQKLREEVQVRDARIKEHNEQIARFNACKASKVRIADLKVREVALSSEYEKLEKHLFLIEEFIKAKVAMFTGLINSKFSIVQFKLFDTQVNGGLVECCDPMVNGIKWGNSGTLNTGAQLNAGLDIINALSEHYGVSAPIWMDNRESVVSIIPVKAQTISLFVSAEDRKLRIETTTERGAA